jgi:hypothetical protein
MSQQLAPAETLALDLAAVRGTSNRSQSSAKVQLPSQRGAQSAQARNGINGRGPPGGKDAVYAGSDLEPIAPRAPGVPPP